MTKRDGGGDCGIWIQGLLSTHVQFHVALTGPALRFLDKKRNLYSRSPLLVTAGNVMGIHRFGGRGE